MASTCAFGVASVSVERSAALQGEVQVRKPWLCSQKPISNSAFFGRAVSAASLSVKRQFDFSRQDNFCVAGASSVAEPPVATPKKTSGSGGEFFDYVIVGGGAAGCVLASRLSEDPSAKVLLLEAGPPKGAFYIDLPAGFPFVFRSPFDWAYEGEEEPAVNNRRIYLPRGKLLGGSHAISLMIYQRGDDKDYVQWEKLGAKGWGPEEVKKYYMKAERNQRGSSKFHGSSGPLSVVDAYTAPVTKLFLEAAADVGLPVNKDFNNNWNQVGFGAFQVTQNNGKRETAASSYLKEARERPNLTVRTGATVEKLIVEGNRVLGATYTFEGRTANVYSNREVVMAAGAITTPHILMLSGIGPGDQLSRLGVDVAADVPGVGQNFQDHSTVLFGYECSKPVSLSSKTPFNPLNLANYLLFKEGPLRTNVCEAGGYWKSNPDLESPDIQIRFAPLRADKSDPYSSFAGYSKGQQNFLSGRPTPPGFTVQVVNIRPKSTGSISLRSSNPADRPAIRTGFLSNAEDVESLKRGMGLVRKIVGADVMQDCIKEELCPGAGFDWSDDAALERYIRSSVHTANAIVGTCKMGASSDNLAVVDPSTLKVWGVEGLRVADSSIMPKIVGGQTGAPTMMIAEKASDMLKAAAATGASSAPSMAM